MPEFHHTKPADGDLETGKREKRRIYPIHHQLPINRDASNGFLIHATPMSEPTSSVIRGPQIETLNLASLGMRFSSAYLLSCNKRFKAGFRPVD
jgi:hypothetical protein